MIHVKHVIADAADVGVKLHVAGAGRLQAFAGLLGGRAVSLGLVAESDRDRVYERHVLDCLRAVPAFRPRDLSAYDLGSGAGLPGIVLACALPDRRFRLVEPKRRAAAFLELVVERLGLENAQVLIQRVEDLAEPADVVTARAFAPLERAWAAAWPLLRPGGRLVYFAGAGLTSPEDAARSAGEPEPPSSVDLIPQVASGPPLVIMSRGG
ncbi:MAG: 16S rRNA (guanine(527)-N(7))-methyltransferase RsmG [Actinomycetota bacterium]